MAVQVGSPAPPFDARAYFCVADQFREISLDDYQGQWLCLYFFPMSFWSPCATEVGAFDRMWRDFRERGCQLLGCSTDSGFVHRAWCQSIDPLRQLDHPIMSDITQRISMDYGVLLPSKGVALRGTFLIDPEGTIRWTSVHDLAVTHRATDILRQVESLQAHRT